MNALDNRAARNHVNRMCLAADVPLIESGTAGYEGQVELIKKNLTQCYECLPKAPQKTFPGCTIRNTPSEPIHCIVWAKHLFNQLFGEYDADEDVSPDTADPEAAGDAGSDALKSESNEQGNVQRVSTREWAQSNHYEPKKLFQKLFHDDINYLLSMGNLWKSRRPPTPLVWDDLPDAVAGSSKVTKDGALKDQKTWSIAECANIFAQSCTNLRNQLESLKKDDVLVWDKDDKNAMDFVAACANIRAHIFGIPQKTRFDIKSMAGNIIPAIATSNAIIAGVVVLHAFRVLQSEWEKCQSVYLRLKPNHRGQLIVPEKSLNQPNKNCYVCAAKNEVTLCLDVNTMTVKELEEQVLKKALNMVAPDVISSTGTVIISSEEGETAENNPKKLNEMGVLDGSILKVDDFLQNYELNVTIVQRIAPKDGPDFEIVADPSQLKPKEDEPESSNGGADDDDDDDDLEVIENDILSVGQANEKKRKSISESDGSVSKKRKTEDDDDLDVIIDV
ncbi:SUMO-activating enzyme subunit 2 isoform X2 [Anabrus simplex]